VDETEDGAPVLLPKQTVVPREEFAVFGDLFNECFRAVMIVMEVYLYISNSETNDIRDAVEDLPLVLLLGIEEAVLR
jgi:hypothetical protein